MLIRAALRQLLYFTHKDIFSTERAISSLKCRAFILRYAHLHITPITYAKLKSNRLKSLKLVAPYEN